MTGGNNDRNGVDDFYDISERENTKIRSSTRHSTTEHLFEDTWHDLSNCVCIYRPDRA
jgi:hypothetical protein